MLERGRESGYGIRAVYAKWKRAVFRVAGPLLGEMLTREEVNTCF